jgi:hypothetical protein
MKHKIFETSGNFIIKDNIKAPSHMIETLPKIISPKITKLINSMSDVEGLNKAYATNDNVYLNGNTMYVSGTKHADTLISTLPNFNPIQNYMKGYYQDMWDDLKIPFGMTKYSQRYQEAEQMLKDNPQITNLVSHSLGGSVSLELAKNYPKQNLITTTYGAPVFSDNLQYGNRFRSVGDPVSMFDNGAVTKLPNSINPHSYDNGFENKISS